MSDWKTIRPKLIDAFHEEGIYFCELGLEGCYGNIYMSFAHSKKRRKMVGDDIYHVVLACIPCHQKIEAMAHEQMFDIVEGIIEQRGLIK